MPNQPEDYTRLGGLLLLWYWGLIAGGVLIILAMVIPSLVSVFSLFLYGVPRFIGLLVSVASSIGTAIFYIMAAGQLKARKPQFFDTYAIGLIISLVGGILSNLLSIQSAYGVGKFVGTIVGSLIGFAIAFCCSVMYLSKSKRVAVYFGGRPLQQSRFWGWIRILPDFIISEAMPDPSNIPQMGSQPQQPYGQPYAQQPPVQPQGQPYAQQPPVQPQGQPYTQQPPVQPQGQPYAQQPPVQPQGQPYAQPQAPVQPQPQQYAPQQQAPAQPQGQPYAAQPYAQPQPPVQPQAPQPPQV